MEKTSLACVVEQQARCVQNIVLERQGISRKEIIFVCSRSTSSATLRVAHARVLVVCAAADYFHDTRDCERTVLFSAPSNARRW